MIFLGTLDKYIAGDTVSVIGVKTERGTESIKTDAISGGKVSYKQFQRRW